MKKFYRFFMMAVPVIAACALLLAACDDGDEGTEVGPPVLADPTLSDVVIFGSTQSQVEIAARVVFNGGHTVQEAGFCYNTAGNPTISSSTVPGQLIGALIMGEITGLEREVTYYATAYIKIEDGSYYYSPEKAFMTSDVRTNPSFGTVTPSTVTFTTATLDYLAGSYGDYTAADITDMGVCWSTTSQNPTILNDTYSYTFDMTQDGSLVVPGLASGTTYYFRLYAVTAAGPVYSNMAMATTATPVEPSFGTVSASAETYSSITLDYLAGSYGDYTAAEIAGMGICWSTTDHEPTLANGTYSSTFDISAAGQVTLPDIAPGMTYYLRLFATTSGGTTYSNVVTTSTVTQPTLAVTNTLLSAHRAYFTVDVTVNDQRAPSIAEKGIVWGTVSNPELGGAGVSSYVITGAGTGSSSTDDVPAMILTASTNYYIRAYAKDQDGTTMYGTQSEATTLAPVIGTGGRLAAFSNGTISGSNANNGLVFNTTYFTNANYVSYLWPALQLDMVADLVTAFTDSGLYPSSYAFSGMRHVFTLDESDGRKAFQLMLYSTTVSNTTYYLTFSFEIDWDDDTEVFTLSDMTYDSALTGGSNAATTAMNNATMNAAITPVMNLFLSGRILVDRSGILEKSSNGTTQYNYTQFFFLDMPDPLNTNFWTAPLNTRSTTQPDRPLP